MQTAEKMTTIRVTQEYHLTESELKDADAMAKAVGLKNFRHYIKRNKWECDLMKLLREDYELGTIYPGE